MGLCQCWPAQNQRLITLCLGFFRGSGFRVLVLGFWLAVRVDMNSNMELTMFVSVEGLRQLGSREVEFYGV